MSQGIFALFPNLTIGFTISSKEENNSFFPHIRLLHPISKYQTFLFSKQVLLAKNKLCGVEELSPTFWLFAMFVCCLNLQFAPSHKSRV